MRVQDESHLLQVDNHGQQRERGCKAAGFVVQEIAYSSACTEANYGEECNELMLLMLLVILVRLLKS